MNHSGREIPKRHSTSFRPLFLTAFFWEIEVGDVVALLPFGEVVPFPCERMPFCSLSTLLEWPFVMIVAAMVGKGE